MTNSNCSRAPTYGEIVTAALAGAAYLGYYFVAKADQSWFYYTMCGFSAFRFAQLQRPKSKTWLGVFTCTFVMIEAFQQGLCGAFHFGIRAKKDICVDLVGEDVYRALASLSLATLWMLLFYLNKRRR